MYCHEKNKTVLGADLLFILAILYHLPGRNQIPALLSMSNEWDFPLQYAPTVTLMIPLQLSFWDQTVKNGKVKANLCLLPFTPAKSSQKQTELSRKKKSNFTSCPGEFLRCGKGCKLFHSIRNNKETLVLLSKWWGKAFGRPRRVLMTSKFTMIFYTENTR